MRGPMDLLAALLQGAAFLAFAAALCRPSFGRSAAMVGLLAAAFCLGHGLVGPAERELTTTHTFVAYEGIELEPSAVEFPTDTVTARGWLWPLPFAAVAVLFAAICWRRRAAAPPGPWLLPILLAWSAMAAWLLAQKLAAPAAVVQPAGIDRFLWPAGVAMALRLAATVKQFVPLLFHLALGAEVLRLPAALFSKVATDQRLGTSLDVSGIVDIVHPITRRQFEPRLVDGSGEQQFWLIWAEHLFAYPAFHLLSYTGIAFAVWLMHRHHATPE